MTIGSSGLPVRAGRNFRLHGGHISIWIAVIQQPLKLKSSIPFGNLRGDCFTVKSAEKMSSVSPPSNTHPSQMNLPSDRDWCVQYKTDHFRQTKLTTYGEAWLEQRRVIRELSPMWTALRRFHRNGQTS